MKKLRITVGKKTYDVTVEVLSDDEAPRGRPTALRPASAAAPSSPEAPPPTAAAPPTGAAPPNRSVAAGGVTSPMSGTVKSVLVQAGDSVEEGQALMLLDAMKMEVPVSAPIAGVVKSVAANEGQSVQEGQILLILN